MSNARHALRTARPSSAAILVVLAAMGCHRDNVRVFQVLPSLGAGPMTTSVQVEPEPLKPAAIVNIPAPAQAVETSTPGEPARTVAESSDSTEEPPVELPTLPRTTDLAAAPGSPLALPDRSEPAGEPRRPETPLLDAAIARASLVEADARAAEKPVELPPPSSPAEEAPPQPGRPEGIDVKPLAAPDVSSKAELNPSVPADGQAEVPGPLPIALEKAPAPDVPSKPEHATPEKAAPAENWQDDLERLRDLAHRRADEPGTEVEAWRLRARLLDWLEGGGTTPEQAELLSRLLTLLGPGGSAPAQSDVEKAATLRETVDALESVVPLRVSDLQVCRAVNGFGDFETLDASQLQPGQAVILYCEMAGLRYAPVEGGLRSRLGGRVELVPRGGDAAVWRLDLAEAKDLCRRRRRDYYVNYRVTIPADIAPGSYDIRMIQTDLEAQSSATASLPVELRH